MSFSFLRLGVWSDTTIRIIIRVRKTLIYFWLSWTKETINFQISHHTHKE